MISDISILGEAVGDTSLAATELGQPHNDATTAILHAPNCVDQERIAAWLPLCEIRKDSIIATWCRMADKHRGTGAMVAEIVCSETDMLPAGPFVGMSSTTEEDRKRAVMQDWMDAHPHDVLFDDSKEFAFCLAPESLLGIDSAFLKVVEGLHAGRRAALPVAVKILEGSHTPAPAAYAAVHSRVPAHPNVRVL